MSIRPTSPRPLLVLGAAVLTLLASACGNGEADTVAPLQPQEERLVSEILELIELRIAAARDPEQARAGRDALGDLYDETELEALIAELTVDPERGRLVVGAVHDSLEARRTRLLTPAEFDFED